jgi:hypothetical protein
LTFDCNTTKIIKSYKEPKSILKKYPYYLMTNYAYIFKWREI